MKLELNPVMGTQRPYRDSKVKKLFYKVQTVEDITNI